MVADDVLLLWPPVDLIWGSWRSGARFEVTVARAIEDEASVGKDNRPIDWLPDLGLLDVDFERDAANAVLAGRHWLLLGKMERSPESRKRTTAAMIGRSGLSMLSPSFCPGRIDRLKLAGGGSSPVLLGKMEYRMRCSSGVLSSANAVHSALRQFMESCTPAV
ncbi:hypothetical protein ACLOJK_028507 [Asimina triloba]